MFTSVRTSIAMLAAPTSLHRSPGLLIFWCSLIVAMVWILITPTLGRSLWIDEVMAMANYPLPVWTDAFGPLPFYSQSAPPGYSLMLNMVANSPPEVLRQLHAIAILVLVFSVPVRFGYPLRTFIAIALLFLLEPTILRYATEIKYYGLEMAAVCACTAWGLTKSKERPIRSADVLFLSALLCLGNLILVAVIVTFSVVLLLRLSQGLTRTEVLWSSLFFVIAAAVFMLAQHISSLQVHNYPYAYDFAGWDSVNRVVSLLGGILSDAPFYLIVLLLVLGLITGRWGPVLTWCLILALFVASLLLLAFLGRFPATHPRHIIAVLGVVLALPIAVFRPAPTLPWPLVSALGGGALAFVVFAGGLLQIARIYEEYWRTSFLFQDDDNVALTEWIADIPPTTIALWHGALPAIRYYQRFAPELAKHDYRYVLNDLSGRVDPEFFAAASGNRSYDDVAAQIEGQIDAPGAWSRFVSVYTIYRDFNAPAKTLLEELAEDGSFLIAASRMHGGIGGAGTGFRTQGLLDTLHAASCAWSVAMNSKKVYVLEVQCPPLR